MAGDNEAKRRAVVCPIDDGTLGFSSIADTKDRLDT